MKPWEQEWGQFSFDARIVTRTSDGLVVADPRGDSHAETTELARFIASAPDMARALLNILQEGGHTTRCQQVAASNGPCSEDCALVNEALRKAGVIP